MTRTRLLTAALITAATAVGVVNADPEFSAERIKAHVTFLADDLLEGREAGTRGHELAAHYIATQFELLGVKPAGENGTYFQNVDLLEAAQSGTKPRLILTTRRGAQTFEHGRAVMVNGPIAGGTVRLDAPLVFAGYGMKDTTLGYDDYAGLDVRGKIAAFPWEQVIELFDQPLTTWMRKDGTPFDPNYGLKAAVLIDPKVAGAQFEGATKSGAQVLEEADTADGRPKFFANNYHKPSDDISQSILWSAGAKFAELNYRVVRALADDSAAPRWYADNYFGNLFAPKAAKVPKPSAR